MQNDTEHASRWCECLDDPPYDPCDACNAEPGEPCRPGCIDHTLEHGEL